MSVTIRDEEGDDGDDDHGEYEYEGADEDTNHTLFFNNSD